MKFNFSVGNNEAHRLEFSLDKASGDLRILVDGAQVVRDSQKHSPDGVRRYEVAIGDREKHKVAFMVTYDGQPDKEETSPALPVLQVTAVH
jgi:hypothetical protein